MLSGDQTLNRVALFYTAENNFPNIITKYYRFLDYIRAIKATSKPINCQCNISSKPFIGK